MMKINQIIPGKKPCCPGTCAAVIVAIFIVCSCCTGTGTGYGPTGPAPASTAGPANGNAIPAATGTIPSGGPAITVELVAANMSFSPDVITVPAGAAVTVNFHNREAPGSSQVTGVAHNFALYDSPAVRTVIFRGDIITGGSDTSYRFNAPAVPGTYFFRCDVHPAAMNGRFIAR